MNDNRGNSQLTGKSLLSASRTRSEGGGGGGEAAAAQLNWVAEPPLEDSHFWFT